MPCSLEIITDLDRARQLAPEWRQLARRISAPPFAGPTLALTWWEHLGCGRLLVAALRSQDGALVAVGPFHERRYGPLRVVRFLGHGLGSVSCLVVGPDLAPDALDQLWDGLWRPGRILQLIEYRHGGPGLAQLRRSERWASHLELRDACPVLALDQVAVTIDQAGVGSPVARRRHLRKHFVRWDRAVEKSGHPFEVAVLTDSAELSSHLADIETVWDRAEEANPRQHLFHPPWGAFTRDALAQSAAHGELAIALGHHGGLPVSVDLAFVSGSTLSDWAGRFDPAAGSFAPGHRMIRALIEWGASRGFRCFDLLVGDAPYKRRWATGSYDTLTVVAARPGRLGHARIATRLLASAHRLRRLAR